MEAINALDEARIRAIKAYAAIEYQLALLLRFIIGVNSSTAWAIFFQITNTKAKYAIIANTLETNGREEYAAAWNTIERWLRPIDTARNHLVHWVDDERFTVTLGITVTGITVTGLR